MKETRMSPVDIFAKFLEKFPQYYEKIEAFEPSGSNSITVYLNGDHDVHFTYNNKNNWRIVDKWKF